MATGLPKDCNIKFLSHPLTKTVSTPTITTNPSISTSGQTTASTTSYVQTYPHCNCAGIRGTHIIGSIGCFNQTGSTQPNFLYSQPAVEQLLASNERMAVALEAFTEKLGELVEVMRHAAGLE